MSREIVDAIKVLEQEKGLDSETLMAALEDALLSAYKKQPGAARYARVDLDRDTADFRVFELILPAELEEKLLAEVVESQEPEIDPATGALKEPEDPELDPEILAPYEDQIESIDVTPENFGRIAAQTAKQVVLQRIREAERMMMFEEFQDRVGELITGIIQQSDNRYTLVQLRDRVEALLPRSEQIYSERYDHGMRIKAVITEVSADGKGPSVVVSRKDPELIKKLFALEVPEIADELVEVVGVAREPGFRSKIAVVSHADGVDPVGACVGPRGSRVRMVVSELRGEKIDIIPYNEEPARFVAKALSPGPGPRGPGRRRGPPGDRDRARRPAFAGDRPRGPERPAGGEADRLARRHRRRERVRRAGRRGRGLRERGGGLRRPLLRGALRRPPLPERRAPELALLRPADPSGAGQVQHPSGHRPRSVGRRRDRPARHPGRPRRTRSDRSWPAPRRPSPRRRPRRPRRNRGGGGGGRGGRRRGGSAEVASEATAEEAVEAEASVEVRGRGGGRGGRVEEAADEQLIEEAAVERAVAEDVIEEEATEEVAEEPLPRRSPRRRSSTRPSN